MIKNAPNGETFCLSPEQKQQLLESIAEADRGEFVDGEPLLDELGRGEGASRAPSQAALSHIGRDAHTR